MSVFNKNNIKKEFLNLLRNSDIFSISLRGVTTTTDSGITSSTGDEIITLGNTGVKNIRSVTYDSALLSYGVGYTIDVDNNQVTLIDVATPKGYSIVYDYSTSSDKIYSDYPRNDMLNSKYPRMGFDLYGMTSRIGAFGNVNFINFRFNVQIYEKQKKALEGYVQALRALVITNQITMNSVSYIRPLNTGSIQEVQGKNNKLLFISIDIESNNNLEAN